MEKLTFLCVHANEISNQARKAWTSKNHLNGHALKKESSLTIVARSGQLERCIKREILLLGRKDVDVLWRGVSFESSVPKHHTPTLNLHGLDTVALSSTVSTKGSLKAMSLMAE